MSAVFQDLDTADVDRSGTLSCGDGHVRARGQQVTGGPGRPPTRSMVVRAGLAIVALLVLAACGSPLYTRHIHTSSTPRPPAFDPGLLAREPVAILGVVAPGALQGLSPTLSHALARALGEVSPTINAIPTPDVLTALNYRGLAGEYGDLLAGFARSGILERDGLRRVGVALGARHVLLPGIAALDQTLFDKFELGGIKLVRSRVIVLRVWLALWDTDSGRLVWESSGEGTFASQIVDAGRVVPLDELAQMLWLVMIEDDLLTGRTRARRFWSG
jgi:hypothetical protein